MAFQIKVYLENGLLVLADTRAKKTTKGNPEDFGVEYLDADLRSGRKITILYSGRPIIVDKFVDQFVTENNITISPDLEIEILLDYFISIGLGVPSGGGDPTSGITQAQADIRYVKNTDVSQAIIQGDTDPVAGGAVQSALAGKVNVSGNKQLSDNNYSDTDKAKVQSLVNYYRGEYPSYSSLSAVTGNPGEYANVDTAGSDLQRYNWDATDSKWVLATIGEGSTGGAVSSVNGKVGAVALVQDDITPGTTYTQYSKTEQARLLNTSGTNTGDETGASIRTKLGITTLSGSNTGDQDLSGLQPKITGKGLSTEDYTTSEKTKLSGIAIGATANTKATIQQAQAGTDDVSYMTPLDTAAAISALTPISALQPETINYLQRIKTAGGSISAADLSSLDTFVATYKSIGVAPVFGAPLTGNDINTAMVKFKVDAGGVSQMVNNNLVAADYLPERGFKLTTNTTKFISTGFTPSANGLSASNITIGYISPDNTTSNFGLFGDNPTSGVASISVSSASNGTVDFKPSLGASSQRAVTTTIGSGIASMYCNGVNCANQTSAVSANATLSSEVTLFKYTTGGNAIYLTGSLAGVWFFPTMTKEQNRLLNLALLKLGRALGRLQTIGGISYGLGDSIMAGIFLNVSAGSFFNLITQANRKSGYNTGLPSSQLRQDLAPYFTSGANRYPDLGSVPFNDILIMYGTNDMISGDATTTGNTTVISNYQAFYRNMVLFFTSRSIGVTALGISYCGELTTAQPAKAALWLAANIAAVKGLCPYVDCWNIFLDTGSAATYLNADKLHPNDLGHALIAKHVVARQQGRPYRDLLVTARDITAGQTSTVAISLPELTLGNPFYLGQPTTIISGVTYSIAYTSDDNATLTITNTTGATVSLPQLNINVTYTPNVI